MKLRRKNFLKRPQRESLHDRESHFREDINNAYQSFFLSTEKNIVSFIKQMITFRRNYAPGFYSLGYQTKNRIGFSISCDSIKTFEQTMYY
jgi:hypothetical protein